MKKIVLTGGGTAGHVTPNIALVSSLEAEGFEIYYIGSKNGMEKDLVEKEGLPYYGISSGKLRRYFDLKNFSDPFRVIKGYFEARKLLKEIKPDIVFSKGGFVTVPVVRAAGSLGIPVVIHEADMTPGLANKLAMPAAKKICCSFPETVKSLPKEKAVYTGCPIRPALYNGDKNKGLEFAGFDGKKPVIMVTGGSLGAANVNKLVREALPLLLPNFDVIHLCGKGKADETIKDNGYRQFEYVGDEMPDVFAAADIVISRAGANAISEISALAKPNILIPLTLSQSRGDQILNAASFEKQGFSYVLEEEKTTPEMLSEAVKLVYENRDKYIEAMKSAENINPVSSITKLLSEGF